MKWITRSKKAALVGVIGLMAAIVPGSPASATAQADVVGVTTTPSGMDLVVRGTATIAGATNVSLVCHVWQTSPSSRHRHVGGVGGPGFAAAAGVAQGMHLAAYNICAEVFIVTPNGSAHIPCPAH